MKKVHKKEVEKKLRNLSWSLDCKNKQSKTFPGLEIQCDDKN